MSTKIYEAYRFPKARMNEFILLFNEIAFKAVRATLKLYQLKPEAIAEYRKELFGNNEEASKRTSDAEVSMVWTLGHAMMASKSLEKDMFDLDCSFNMWVDGNYCYVIPYAGPIIQWRKSLPKWCKDYCYYNNSDEPKGVTEREWINRGKTWNRIALDNWDATRLTHVALELKMPSCNGLRALLGSIPRRRQTRKDGLQKLLNSDWVSRMHMMASCVYWKLDKKDRNERFEREKASREKEASIQTVAKTEDKSV